MRTSRLVANLRTPRYTVPTARLFSHSFPLQKKRKVAAQSSGSTGSEQPSSSRDDSATPLADPEDPLDLSALTASYIPTDAHFKNQLQILSHGGRFNPAALGALPVVLKSDDVPPVPKTFPLQELAQVVPRSGRSISLLLHDRAYVKPIMSAVQASPEFNQQPQRAEDNDLELLLKVELEKPEDAIRRIKDICQAWRERIRQARTRHEKVIREWKRTNAVRPDDARKADKEMQKVQDKKMQEIEQDEARVIKQIGRSGSQSAL